MKTKSIYWHFNF